MTAVRFALQRAVEFGIYGAVVFSIAVAVMAAGPAIELAVAPVFTDVSLVDRSLSDDGRSLRFRLLVQRHRAETCQFERQDWYRVRPGRPIEHASVTIVTDAEVLPGASLPGGMVIGRLLEVRTLGAPEISAVLTYRCALLPWSTRVPIGPFAVSG